MMEQKMVWRGVTISKALERRFRSDIEGCVPDLIDLSDGHDGYRDPDESDRDSIHDYVADRSVDAFPNADDTKRREMVKRVVAYFCGEEEEGEDKTFKVADLRATKPCDHSTYRTFGHSGYPYDVDRGPFCPQCDEVVEL